MAPPMSLRGRQVTTCLKKSKASSPASVWGKAVTEVGRGQEMMEVRKMPMRMAPLTRYIIRKVVRKLFAPRPEVSMKVRDGPENRND